MNVCEYAIMRRFAF